MKLTPEKLRQWRDGPEGFFKWVGRHTAPDFEGEQPFEPIELADWQKRESPPFS
jgi:hypothetical protein